MEKATRQRTCGTINQLVKQITNYQFTKNLMKTLYISDLDGTLLDSTPKTTEFTNKTISELLDNGVIFSFATARSYTTAKKVTVGLPMKYPAVVHNGTFIVDENGKILLKNTFSKNDSDFILSTILDNNLNPLVYSLINEKEQFSYIRSTLNEPTLDFLSTRENDPRNREVFDQNSLFDGEVYYFTLIGDEEKTKPLYKKFKETYQCFYQRDMYSGEYWLEILPKGATKANAVKQLSKMLSCDRIVAFGDGINDVDMFEHSDECYAMENAVENLKKIATGVIKNNNENGVAIYLKHNALPSC